MSHAPVPQGRYVPAKRHGDLIFVSGMTPRRDGVMVIQGPIKTSDALDMFREAVELATTNALSAARNMLWEQERLAGIVSLTVFVAADEGFQAHSKVADFASNLLFAELGEAGIGARAAVGVATLPGGAPVEIQIVASVGSSEHATAS
jgi:enamine deaminase RidA (YjgF/YER057c/UK114 family)